MTPDVRSSLQTLIDKWLSHAKTYRAIKRHKADVDGIRSDRQIADTLETCALELAAITAVPPQPQQDGFWGMVDAIKAVHGPFEQWPDQLKDAFATAIIDTSPLTAAEIARGQELAERFGWEKLGVEGTAVRSSSQPKSET